MKSWTNFVEWCKKRSKLKVRTFNPRNIMVVTFSVVLISIIASGVWLYQVLSVAQTIELTKDTYEILFPTLIITEDTTLTEDHHGMVVIAANGVTLDGNGHTITGPGVWMWSSTQRMWDFSTGITIMEKTGVTVKNCRITNFAHGVIVDSCNGNTLLNNTVYDNVYFGILLSTSYNNTLLDNTVYGIRDVVNNQDGQGFIVELAFGNTFKNNIAHDNGWGYSVEMSFGNTFKNNIAHDNDCGFQIMWVMEVELFEDQWGFIPEATDGNIFESNTAEGNTESGFLITGDLNNIFFHNNLIDNTIQAALQPVHYPEDEGEVRIVWGANIWDDGCPSGGNYWSDYEGVDADDDGIGDTPYNIPTFTYETIEDPTAKPIPIVGEPNGNNIDRFPLMAPFND